MELAWGLLEKKYIFVYFFSCLSIFAPRYVWMDGAGVGVKAGKWDGWMDCRVFDRLGESNLQNLLYLFYL